MTWHRVLASFIGLFLSNFFYFHCIHFHFYYFLLLLGELIDANVYTCVYVCVYTHNKPRKPHIWHVATSLCSTLIFISQDVLFMHSKDEAWLESLIIVSINWVCLNTKKLSKTLNVKRKTGVTYSGGELNLWKK